MFNDETQEVTPEIVTEEIVEEAIETEAPAETDWEAEARRLQAELGKAKRQVTKIARKAEAQTDKLAVEDFIDISTSLDGLDQQEKAYLAEQHRLSGKPLKDIREGKDFQLWQSGYRAILEKERALTPNATQESVDTMQKGSREWFRTASLEEKEEFLNEKGLWKAPRPKLDRTNIGNTMR